MDLIIDFLGTILVELIFGGLIAAATSENNSKPVRCIFALILTIIMLAFGALTIIMFIISGKVFTGNLHVKANHPIGVFIFIVGLLMTFVFIKFLIKMKNIYRGIMQS